MTVQNRQKRRSRMPRPATIRRSAEDDAYFPFVAYDPLVAIYRLLEREGEALTCGQLAAAVGIKVDEAVAIVSALRQLALVRIDRRANPPRVYAIR